MNGSQTSFDDFPFRAVDHDRYGADIGLTCNQPQVLGDRGRSIEQSIIHIDVNDGSAALNLIAGDFDRFLKLLLADQAGEFATSGHIGALAHHQEVGLRSQR